MNEYQIYRIKIKFNYPSIKDFQGYHEEYLKVSSTENKPLTDDEISNIVISFKERMFENILGKVTSVEIQKVLSWKT